MTWTITWPQHIDAAALDANVRRLCEVYAAACMSALTLHRVGGNPVTIMPAAGDRVAGWYALHGVLDGQYPLGIFTLSAADLTDPARWHRAEAISLPGPVGAVTAVKIDGAVLPSAAYRVEDGRWLVRTDGGVWPAGAGDHFTVTYINSHPVDEMGAHAAGVMAAEWLKVFTRSKDKCRLPSNATNVARQGITIEVATGMFPEGVTGMPEIDAYLMLWNPHGLRVAPRVYSPDLPKHRQVWHA